MFFAVDVTSLIALVVSVFALVTSGLSAWYTRQQARATQGTLELEKKRELERSRPPVEVHVLTLDREAGPWVKIKIQNNGVRTLDRVKLKILDDYWNLFKFDGDTHETERRSISPGDTGIVPMTRPDPMLNSCRVKIFATYRAGDDEWYELLERSVQPPLPTSPEAAD